MLDLAVQAGDTDLEKRCLARALEDHKPEELVWLAEMFHRHRRNEKTLELYREALAEIDDPSSELLGAASLAIQPIDEKASIAWQHRSLKKLQQEGGAIDQEAIANLYLGLISRPLEAGDLSTAEQLALEGYENFPSQQQHRVITYIAGQHHKAGDLSERWRWLSTISLAQQFHAPKP